MRAQVDQIPPNPTVYTFEMQVLVFLISAVLSSFPDHVDDSTIPPRRNRRSGRRFLVPALLIGPIVLAILIYVNFFAKSKPNGKQKPESGRTVRSK
jgi:hypothetical protein